MNVINNITTCRICDSTNLKIVISLGDQYITSRFPKYCDFSTPKTPIDLCVCQNCRLLQLYQTTLPSELYEYEYGYRSGISNTMREHLKKYQEEILSIVQLNEGDVIVDIGSNDSTMLQYYSNKLKRIGVDPTGSQFQEYYINVELLATYFTHQNFKNIYGDIKCKLVSSISMFYDLPQPVQFAKDIYNILDDNGIWTCEQSYLLSMLKTNSIDTICHEHLEYYSLHQIKEIADRSNFKIIKVEFNDCNGGSFRIYFAKKDSSMYKEDTEVIDKIIKEEIEYGLHDDNIFKHFMDNCDNQINKLKKFIDVVNKNNKKIYIYGASTKGNCLLQYGNITENDIKYAVERNPKKEGKMTSTGIRIIMEEQMRKEQPDYLLVLPWHFKNEIIQRESDFLEKGGQFIFPFPEFEIIGSKPKVVITGCNGMIAQYVIKRFNNFNLYGIGKNEDNYDKNITKFFFDMNDYNELDNVLTIIEPHHIIHLASISSSHYAFNNPIETLKTNGLITSYLCEIIHKNCWKTKLFNASSSEIYKGHITYNITENDNNMFHNHPYSIAKIMGQSIVNFYRQTYNLPFSNGIIFTVESSLKKSVFLLNKISNHIKNWLVNKEPIILGNLDSYRNIIHASDVANAIFYILEEKNGNNYLICNDNSYKIIDLVKLLYSRANINLIKDNNIFYDTNTNLPVIIIQENQLSFESTPTNISGTSTNLKNIGWEPLIPIENILDEIYFKI
uniref:GDP-mannose 4,6-dehydratase n=1 Tax=viral metagenome TaxID=1070528 RepID=A0A6C0I1X5_9ZZZZ